MAIGAKLGLDLGHRLQPLFLRQRLGEAQQLLVQRQNALVHGTWRVRRPAATLLGNASASQIVAGAARLYATSTHSFDYDLVVIGGGSGGLACSKEAARFGKRVCVLDFVKPSPQGTSWGLGGTCVNVGCIPKKLMHHSALLGDSMRLDGANLGWTFGEPQFDWQHLVQSVNGYIRGINFRYRVELRDKRVTYENALGTLVDAHTIELSDPRKKAVTRRITAENIVIAVGGRPRPLDCQGGEHAITSDDLFWKQSPPGKTLVVGASFVALECAGFLKALGFDVRVMVRSILLRGFDQEMATRVGSYMESECSIPFLRETVVRSISRMDDCRLLVKWEARGSQGENGEGVFDTVLNATGRSPDIAGLGLDKVGVVLGERGHIQVKNEQSSVSNIFAIGDVIDAPELTPVAVQAGRFLARRLFNSEQVHMDYDNVCSTVFTPIEYGSCGLSEEESIKRLGEDNVEVFHQSFIPLEWTLSDERVAKNHCFIKVICDKSRDLRVVGFHYLGPNAGEVTQAIGVAMKVGFTHKQMIETIGIHPTNAEVFTTMEVTKRSGDDASATGC